MFLSSFLGWGGGVNCDRICCGCLLFSALFVCVCLLHRFFLLCPAPHLCNQFNYLLPVSHFLSSTQPKLCFPLIPLEIRFQVLFHLFILSLFCCFFYFDNLHRLESKMKENQFPLLVCWFPLDDLSPAASEEARKVGVTNYHP